ncbi:MAG: dihydrofolate reductase [Alphaproteobacteria bacterium]|nr:dihydrofolate reductase [Alphaproteobacteria bacterium]
MNLKPLAAIVAMSQNRVIGWDNDIPWYIPADLKHFKKNTLGKPCIMGRKTYDSIIARLGKPLPERTNIVISRTPDLNDTRALWATSLDEAIEKAQACEGAEIMIIGGAQIYELALPKLDRMYITEIMQDYEGDAFYPVFSRDEWNLLSQENNAADIEKNIPPYAFCLYAKKPA